METSCQVDFLATTSTESLACPPQVAGRVDRVIGVRMSSGISQALYLGASHPATSTVETGPNMP